MLRQVKEGRPAKGFGYPSRPEGLSEKWEGLNKNLRPENRALDQKREAPLQTSQALVSCQKPEPDPTLPVL
ncbi:hypothetical protein COLO4_25643 [Corchorus olitorius]|uniref:Uncharacterized protein n=1 Tax=Corchorus olitorius TaxID=93759 RepID=A0A1R3I175_9ROSI|nr:hypothetical protein COLO4_25643 [Corchorus olitorius]